VNVPNGLDAPAKALWKRVVSDLQQREVLRDVDASAIERYVRSEMVARQAWARLAAREKVEGAAAWRCRATHGGWMPDPDVRIAQSATKDAAQFAHDLGITPRARAQIRVPAHADEIDEFLAELANERR
jgi:P27 family predicted phage terminase small subunit